MAEAEKAFDAIVLKACDHMKAATLVPLNHPETGGEPLGVVEVLFDKAQDAFFCLELIGMFRGFEYTAVSVYVC